MSVAKSTILSHYDRLALIQVRATELAVNMRHHPDLIIPAGVRPTPVRLAQWELEQCLSVHAISRNNSIYDAGSSVHLTKKSSWVLDNPEVRPEAPNCDFANILQSYQ